MVVVSHANRLNAVIKSVTPNPLSYPRTYRTELLREPWSLTINYHSLLSRYAPHGTWDCPWGQSSPTNCLEEVIESVTLNPFCYSNSY